MIIAIRTINSNTPVIPADPFTHPSDVLVVNMYSHTSNLAGSVVTIETVRVDLLQCGTRFHA
jgi:hypothetical protein